MCGQVHQDERHLLVGDVECLVVGGRFPSADIILDFPIIQSQIEPLDEEDFVPHVRIGVSQMVEDPHASM